MKKALLLMCMLALLALLLDSPASGRGGGCFRGGGGGGFRGGGGGFPGGGARGGVVQSYGGGAGAHVSRPVVGPGGGAGQVGRAGGSFTTQGGSTVRYGGIGAGGTTAGGVTGGRAVGGGHGAAVAGPGGNAIGDRSGVTVGTGPQGAMASRYAGGVAIGPQGAAAGRARVGVASGPGGAVAGASRAGIASGPYGAVAGRAGVVAGAGGTYYRSAAVVRGQGVAVRRSVATYPCFRPSWYARYPGAWLATGWAAGAVWRAATWPAYQGFCGYSGYAPYYEYGDNIVLQDNQVYIDGTPICATEVYAEQAATLAKAGQDAAVTAQEEWLPLGVFAMVQGEEQTSNHIFQLAVNKQGIIRGNYYDAVTDTTLPVAGSVEKKNQRAAWRVGDRPSPVYEAGIANLTERETSMLVHYGDRSQQFTLIRIEEPAKTE